MRRKAIVVEHLSYRYPDGKEALKDVTFEVMEGESVALMGPNGAGKTTLFLHINGLLKGYCGSVKVFGHSVDDKRSIKYVRRTVGIVFQNPDDQLFCSTVFDDVAFGPLNMDIPKGQVYERVRKALEAVSLSGYEGRAPQHLSLGEKKRVSIATVLSMEPEIILLDEPSSNLDPRSRRRIMKAIKELNGTKIIATHDLEMALELCERGIIMDEGKIVGDGDIYELLTNKELLERHGLEVPCSLSKHWF